MDGCRGEKWSEVGGEMGRGGGVVWIEDGVRTGATRGA